MLEIDINRDCHTGVWQELVSLGRLARYASRLRRLKSRPLILVGCDPLAYAEARFLFWLFGVNPNASAVWFVDWSAQRLKGRVSGPSYRWITQSSARRADAVLAISKEAAVAISDLVGSDLRRSILVVCRRHKGLGYFLKQ